MATWRSVSSKLRGAAALGAILVAVAAGASVTPFLVSCADTAEAGTSTLEERRQERAAKRLREAAERRQRWEERERERDERWAKADQEAEERRRALEAEMAKAPPPKKHVRRVRRFTWESPAETRGKIWNVPVEETADALLTALLRVCIAEADGDPQDCAGIWQVVKNNRRRSCDRGMIRRITECTDEGGETYLSALRRHQRHVLGYIKARNKRAVWIGNLTPDCEMPEGWPYGENRWDAQYGSKTCPQTVADARSLIAGKLPESRPGARTTWLPGRPVTWGGRCETGKAACDDRIACERVLARIPDTGTHNAFWCRIGSARCRPDPEPICLALGYQYEQVDRDGRLVWRLKVARPEQRQDEAEIETETPGEDTSTVTAIEPAEGPDENS